MSFLNSSRVKAPAYLVPNSYLVSLETNEPSSPNSPEREVGDRLESETQPKTQKLLICKHPSIFSTINARSITLVSCKRELLSSFSKFQIDVLSIQDHRVFHPDTELKHTDLSKSKLKKQLLPGKQPRFNNRR